MTAAGLKNFLPRTVGHIPQLDRYATLKQNWQYSVDRLTELRESLRGKLSENVETVAVAGSFGRFEGSTVSDADFILIVSDKDDPSVESDRDVIIKAISDLDVSPPNKSGVFAQPRTVEELEETMYAGLLFLIGEASKDGTAEKSQVIWKSLGLTPLERLAHVYEACGERCFFRVLGPYNVFLAKLSDPELRPRLNAIGYEERYSVPEFAELKWNSDSLSAELLRFVFARRGSWSERFFEYLLF